MTRARACATGPAFRVLFTAAVLRAYAGFALSDEPQLSFRALTPSAAAQGDLVRISASSAERLDALSVRLESLKCGSVSRSEGFLLSRGNGSERWMAFLGIPSTAQAGEYRLVLSARQGGRDAVLVKSFILAGRTFLSERIPLDRQLAALRTTPDPRKAEEARELRSVLSAFHPDSIYETGTLAAPVPAARRSAGYGDRREYDYADSGTDLSIHSGIDLASPEGTPVFASGRGRVVMARDRILSGQTAVIEHLPGLFSLYFHMSVLLVKTGEMVEKGQVIGKVGKTGLATGPHLHWEVQAAGVAVDPLPLILHALIPQETPEVMPQVPAGRPARARGLPILD